MFNKKTYVNGQPVYTFNGDTLTYFFKDGKTKAHGLFIDGKMEGEWKFYRETGQLWQTGNFKNGVKHGLFLRYSKDNLLEYQESFENNKKLKKTGK